MESFLSRVMRKIFPWSFSCHVTPGGPLKGFSRTDTLQFHRKFELRFSDDLNLAPKVTCLRQIVIGTEHEWRHPLLNLPTTPFSTYRVSHSKPCKVISLRWRYRLWFLLIFWILHVHEKGTFMANSTIFIFLMLRAIYGSISRQLLFLNKFWTILTFKCLFQVIKSNKPLKIYIFL